jgi:desulfoferrodoxin-like iron-binding protein
VEKGNKYTCEICGSEIVCIEDSAGNIVCCEEPMCLIIG